MPTEGVGRFSFRRVLWGRSPHTPPGGLRPRTPGSGAPTRSRVAPSIHPSSGPHTQAAPPPRPARLGFACQSCSAPGPPHPEFVCQSRSAPGPSHLGFACQSRSASKACPPRVRLPKSLRFQAFAPRVCLPKSLRPRASHPEFVCQSRSAPGPSHLGFACQSRSARRASPPRVRLAKPLRSRAFAPRVRLPKLLRPKASLLGFACPKVVRSPGPHLGSPTSSRFGPFPTSARLEDSRPEPLLAHPSRFGPPPRPAQPKPLRTGAPRRRSTPDTQLGSHSKSPFPGRLLRFRARSHFPPGHSSRSLPKLLPSEPHHELACPGFGARPRVAGRGHFAKAHPLDAASSPTPASARPRDVSSPPRSHFGSLISCCGRASLRTRRAGVARCSVAAQWVSPDHHPSGARIVRCSPSIAHRRRLCSGPPAAPHRVVAAACDSAGLASINRRTDRGNPEDAR
ncbi:hypothetical protein APR11_004891 [Nocardia amikacinitolerans]|nr:hypothetical protein [Nocardia amikacinitolerans]